MISLLTLYIHDILHPTHFTLVFGIAIGYVFSYSLNDYLDASNDKLDRYKSSHNFYVKYSVPNYYVAGFYLILMMMMFFIFNLYGKPGLLVLVVSIFVTWAYSAKPIKLKLRPFIDVLTHSFFVVTYPYFILMYLLQIEWNRIDYLVIIILLIGSSIIQLENQIRDHEIDRIIGKTTTVVIGMENSLKLIKFLTCILILLAIIGLSQIPNSLFLFPVLLIYSPVIIQRLKTKSNVRSESFIRKIIILEILYSMFLIVILYLK